MVSSGLFPNNDPLLGGYTGAIGIPEEVVVPKCSPIPNGNVVCDFPGSAIAFPLIRSVLLQQCQCGLRRERTNALTEKYVNRIVIAR